MTSKFNSQSEDRVGLVVNPQARGGMAQEALPLIRETITQEGKKPKVWCTKKPGQGSDLAQEFLHRGFKKIVAVGGDGTFNEVIQPIVGTEARVGFIPTGLANDFAKTLNIPSNPKRAAKLVCSDRGLDIDVGKLVYSGRRRYFLGCLGIGFDAQVAAEAYGRNTQKGIQDFAEVAFEELFKFEEQKVAIKTSQWKHDDSVLMVAIGNGRREGRYFKVTPRARLNDGLLDICLVKSLPTWKRILALAMSRFGLHLRLSEVDYKLAKQAEINFPWQWKAHCDGEILNLSSSKIKVRLVPKALTVIPGPCPEYRSELSVRNKMVPRIPFLFRTVNPGALSNSQAGSGSSRSKLVVVMNKTHFDSVLLTRLFFFLCSCSPWPVLRAKEHET